MLTDYEIAKQAGIRPIKDIATKLGVDDADLMPYGDEMAKVNLSALNRPRNRPDKPRLVLVSATTPTAAGEGKTTTSIGLAQAMDSLGESVCLALREPSLGPCLGIKGGATGGGYSQIVPVDRINLHFTGDFHAITTVNNLISATIDNHIFQGNELGLDPRQIVWRRVMDMNDRSLRNIIIGLGGRMQGIPRQGGFDITAASEIMAILCLANDVDDLRARLDNILVGTTWKGKPIYLKALNITGAMMALLRDAVHPNLVQTLEGTPAFMHGGPFANIAHGCNSVFATRMAMHYADWTITEAGFGVFWKNHYIKAVGTPNILWEGTTIESEIRFNVIHSTHSGIFVGIKGTGTPESGEHYIHHNIVTGPFIIERPIVKHLSIVVKNPFSWSI